MIRSLRVGRVTGIRVNVLRAATASEERFQDGEGPNAGRENPGCAIADATEKTNSVMPVRARAMRRVRPPSWYRDNEEIRRYRTNDPAFRGSLRHSTTNDSYEMSVKYSDDERIIDIILSTWNTCIYSIYVRMYFVRIESLRIRIQRHGKACSDSGVTGTFALLTRK